MNQSCDGQGLNPDHQHLDFCEFRAEAARHGECTLDAQVQHNGSSNKLGNKLVFQVLPDKVLRTEHFTGGDYELLMDEATKHQVNNAGIQIQNETAEASRCRNSYQALLLSREMLIREFIRLGRLIKRRTVVCFTPSSGADQDDVPYMQLDKVTHAPRIEDFGPLYLVT